MKDAQGQRALAPELRPAAWLVWIEDTDRAVAAGPTAEDALAHARALGYGSGAAFPVSPAEVAASGLDACAAGAVEGERPWRRERAGCTRL